MSAAAQRADLLGELIAMASFDVADEGPGDPARPADVPGAMENQSVFLKIRGAWWIAMGLPNRIRRPIINRLLVMANVPYWSKKEGAGVIRLRVSSSDVRTFHLRYDPAAPRVVLELVA